MKGRRCRRGDDLRYENRVRFQKECAAGEKKPQHADDKQDGPLGRLIGKETFRRNVSILVAGGRYLVVARPVPFTTRRPM